MNFCSPRSVEALVHLERAHLTTINYHRGQDFIRISYFYLYLNKFLRPHHYTSKLNHHKQSCPVSPRHTGKFPIPFLMLFLSKSSSFSHQNGANLPPPRAQATPLRRENLRQLQTAPSNLNGHLSRDQNFERVQLGLQTQRRCGEEMVREFEERWTRAGRVAGG
jgi:hypothetical protein